MCVFLAPVPRMQTYSQTLLSSRCTLFSFSIAQTRRKALGYGLKVYNLATILKVIRSGSGHMDPQRPLGNPVYATLSSIIEEI